MLMNLIDRFYSLFGDPVTASRDEKVGFLVLTFILSAILGFFLLCISPYSYVVSNLIKATLLS